MTQCSHTLACGQNYAKQQKEDHLARCKGNNCAKYQMKEDEKGAGLLI